MALATSDGSAPQRPECAAAKAAASVTSLDRDWGAVALDSESWPQAPENMTPGNLGMLRIFRS